MDTTLKNKTALVTGGTKGIGYGIAIALLKTGMRVMITGRTDASVQEAINNIPQVYQTDVIGKVANVTDLEALEACKNEMMDKWGSVDVLIANAGVGHFAAIDEMTSDQWNETIDVNLTGVFNSVKACVEEIKKSSGYIITIASLAGTNFFSRGAAYNASKFGLVGFTQAIMLDLRDYGVKCTTIMPGSVASYFNNNIPSEKDAWKIQPEDIGQMVVDLLNTPARTLPSKIEVRPSQPPKK
jgi:NADP-dependent 3-hydroxy acid dehydrogenase YdfG